MTAAWCQARCAGCLVFSSCAETHTTTYAEVAGVRRCCLAPAVHLQLDCAITHHHIHCPALTLATIRCSVLHMLHMPTSMAPPQHSHHAVPCTTCEGCVLPHMASCQLLHKASAWPVPALFWWRPAALAALPTLRATQCL